MKDRKLNLLLDELEYAAEFGQGVKKARKALKAYFQDPKRARRVINEDFIKRGAK